MPPSQADPVPQWGLRGQPAGSDANCPLVACHTCRTAAHPASSPGALQPSECTLWDRLSDAARTWRDNVGCMQEDRFYIGLDNKGAPVMWKDGRYASVRGTNADATLLRAHVDEARPAEGFASTPATSTEKPFECAVCWKRFASRVLRSRHERIHSGEQPFACTECHKRFLRKSDLNVHLRTHTGERPYRCPDCPRRFNNSGNLRNHRRTHTGERPYRCTECPKSFATSGNLRNHLRTHTGEKPYGCSECPKRFSESSHLKNHIRTHTGERPYKCPECPRRFGQSGNLTTHLRTHDKLNACRDISKRYSSSGSTAAPRKLLNERGGVQPYPDPPADVCVQQGRIYIGHANKGISAMLKDSRYAVVSGANVDPPLWQTHVAAPPVRPRAARACDAWCGPHLFCPWAWTAVTHPLLL